MKLDTCSLILFSILVLFSCLHTNIYAQVLEQDSLALVALYNSTNGGSWNHNTNWLAGPVEEWYGVIVSEGRVIEISMDHNNIEGVIPPEIGDLTALTAFRLYFNKLTSPLPIEMGNMTSLTILNLGNNQIGDTIPSIIASNLKNLEALALDNNNFTGSIPPELDSLTNLHTLLLNNNQLNDSIPSRLGNITQMVWLNLSNNQLTGTIPSDLGKLTNLSYLFLNNNDLTGSIPTELKNLSIVTWIDLSYNQLSGNIPSELGGLSNLNGLYLHQNNLNGAIPVEIGDLTNLQYLNLEYNQLSDSIPADLGYLTKLINVKLDSNEFTGSIPAELGNLSSVTWVDLSYNQLNGYIPAEIGDMTSLQTLNVSNNNLSNDIPAEITSATNLLTLNAQNNQITGLPDLSSLSGLNSIWVENNQLTFEDIEPNIGVAPFFDYSPQDSVGDTKNITSLEGSSVTVLVTVGGTNNQYQWYKNGGIITGATEDSYSINPVSFSDLGSYHCQITNTVATGLTLYSRKTNITVITSSDSVALAALYDNTNGSDWTTNTGWLTEPLDGWYGTTVVNKKVTGINLADNNLVGNVPGELVILDSLETLNVSANQLNGFPDLSSLENLINLNVSDNKLTFEDIEPNIGIETFSYSPQDSIGEAQDTNLTEGGSLMLIVNVGGTANQYQWYKNGSEIEGADSSAFEIASLALADSGSYICQISNSIVTDLTLYSRPVDVKISPATAITDHLDQIPNKFALHQNYPNPFNPETIIKYALPDNGHLSLAIYDLLGHKVKTLVNEVKSAGVYTIQWDGTNVNGQPVGSGVYLYQLKNDQGIIQTKKMILMR